MCVYTRIYPYSLHIIYSEICIPLFILSAFIYIQALFLADTYFAKSVQMWHSEFKVKLYTSASSFATIRKTKNFAKSNLVLHALFQT